MHDEAAVKLLTEIRDIQLRLESSYQETARRALEIQQAAVETQRAAYEQQMRTARLYRRVVGSSAVIMVIILFMAFRSSF
ncbi:hypothetical protein [Tahibacter amnicola]|uniref:Uncharacterized protein n=1 Tax=Tahibacter amnicola TaxID=2976241 RepID=A0ABY6BIL0_9GAMM|nr:hypothetical protein [Tahibacter amnicola]UXI69704.1 hypothetical protein N4264_08750 [Tahibacter amnicola]